VGFPSPLPVGLVEMRRYAEDACAGCSSKRSSYVVILTRAVACMPDFEMPPQKIYQERRLHRDAELEPEARKGADY